MSNFERGQDPKHTICIGKRAQIDKWFKEWAPDADYSVDKDLHISVEEGLYFRNIRITSLPDNLSVEGYLNLENTQITSLPDNLSVKWSLYLRNTKITSLPDSLSVGGDIYKNF